MSENSDLYLQKAVNTFASRKAMSGNKYRAAHTIAESLGRKMKACGCNDLEVLEFEVEFFESNGIVIPESLKDALCDAQNRKKQFASAAASFDEWFFSHFEVTPSRYDTISKNEFLEKYGKYCIENGIQNIGKKEVTNRLINAGCLFELGNADGRNHIAIIRHIKKIK